MYCLLCCSNFSFLFLFQYHTDQEVFLQGHSNFISAFPRPWPCLLHQLVARLLHGTRPSTNLPFSVPFLQVKALAGLSVREGPGKLSSQLSTENKLFRSPTPSSSLCLCLQLASSTAFCILPPATCHLRLIQLQLPTSQLIQCSLS